MTNHESFASFAGFFELNLEESRFRRLMYNKLYKHNFSEHSGTFGVLCHFYWEITQTSSCHAQMSLDAIKFRRTAIDTVFGDLYERIVPGGEGHCVVRPDKPFAT